MSKIIDIGAGTLFVAKGDVVMRTLGIGSCLAICLYDKENEVGGMSHAMLPTNKFKSKDSTLRAKYVDESIEILIEQIKKKGGKMENITAKNVGGANIIKSTYDLGNKNIECARKIFSDMGIELIGEVVGGSIGRSVEFNLRNGVLNIKTAL